MTALEEPRPRRRRHRDTRERIADAALELFNARGFDGASMRELASQLDVTIASLYYHYADKDDILVQLVEPLLDDAARRIADATEAGLDIEGRLEVLLDLLIAHRDVYRLLTNDVSARNNPAIAERVDDHNIRLFRFIRGPKEHPDEAALVRAVAAVGALYRPIAVLPHVDPNKHRDLLLDAAVSVYGAGGRRRRRRTTATRPRKAV